MAHRFGLHACILAPKDFQDFYELCLVTSIMLDYATCMYIAPKSGINIENKIFVILKY